MELHKHKHTIAVIKSIRYIKIITKDLKQMKSMRYIIIFFLLIGKVCSHAGLHAENCDSLIQIAIQASLEKDYQYSLELLSQAKQLAINEKSPEKLFRILMNIGVNKAELLDYNNALNNFFDAYKLAVDKLDKRYEMKVLNNIAGLFMQENKVEKAQEYYMKVYNSVKNSSDSLFIGGCAMNLASVYMNMNNLVEADRFLGIAENMLKKYLPELTKLQTLKVSYYLQKGNPKQAYDVAFQLYRQSDKQIRNSTLWLDIQMALVNSCMGLEDYEASITFSLKALEGNLNIEERKFFFQILSEAYYKIKRYPKAFAYKDSMISAINSLWDITGKKQYENNRIQFELFKREKEFEEYKTKHQTELIFWGLSAIIAIILIWALVNQVVKNKQQKKIIELELDQEKKNQLLLQNRLDEEQAKSSLERKQFQQEIEMKGRELVSNALIVANRNNLIQEILDILSTSETIKKSKELKLKEAIRKLRKQLVENEEWKHFTTYFEQANDTFINSLIDKHPDLTANEVRFLSLVYINLSTKEISSLLNITPEYCKKKKQQITHKLGLDGTKSLYSYLISI